MKAREFVKRAFIYSLGLGIYTYELWIATIEGLGLNARGFWGEPERQSDPTHAVEPDEHVAAVDPVAEARRQMFERAARDFDRWDKMTPAERAANIATRLKEEET